MRKREIERSHVAEIASFVEQYDREEDQDEDQPERAGPPLWNRSGRADGAGLETIEIRCCVARA
jgi:hypothetical protein